MSKTLKVYLILLLSIFINECNGYENWRNNFQYSQQNLQNQQNLRNLEYPTRKPPFTELVRTRSLSGGLATNGSEATTAMVLQLMKVGLLDGFAIRRIKMFNDRVYLARYRRSYWFGTRYYTIDNRYYLETRETCAYRMNETERQDLEYEENIGEPILDIIYQCQRYAQYCCGLDCCQNVNRRSIEQVKEIFSPIYNSAPALIFSMPIIMVFIIINRLMNFFY